MSVHVGAHMFMHIRTCMCACMGSPEDNLKCCSSGDIHHFFKQVVFLNLGLTEGRLADEADRLSLYPGLSNAEITSLC